MRKKIGIDINCNLLNFMFIFIIYLRITSRAFVVKIDLERWKCKRVHQNVNINYFYDYKSSIKTILLNTVKYVK
jgi:hypothetical protein